ncbi:MAG TPA: hypothetical protein VGH91_05820 [Gammaproteobacteria bacterium]
MKMPCIGDIEASGLALNSYPVEVGWSLPNGEIRSRLVRTDVSWGNFWDPNAEALHRISREMLRTDGVASSDIAKEINRDLAGETLYFDGSDFDLNWLNKLFDAAKAQPTFRFGDFNALLAEAGVRDGSRRLASGIRAREDIGDLPLHRAAHDVQFLQRWYIRARGGMRY